MSHSKQKESGTCTKYKYYSDYKLPAFQAGVGCGDVMLCVMQCALPLVTRGSHYPLYLIHVELAHIRIWNNLRQE